MTQHCDAEQRANSARNPSHSTVLGTPKHSRIPGCNLVNTLRAVPEQYDSARRLPTTSQCCGARIGSTAEQSSICCIARFLGCAKLATAQAQPCALLEL